MSSIFIGMTGLRHQYEDLTFTEINGATDAASSVLLLQFAQAGRMAFIDNTLNVDVQLLLVHPDADSTVAALRLFWIEVPANRVVNYDINQAGLIFDPGARIYAAKAAGAGAATSGKIRISVWG